MSDLNEIEREILEYLNQEPNLRRQDRVKFLMAIINKHLEFSKLEHAINYYDLQNIISVAKNGWTRETLPMFVSGKQIESSEVGNAMVVEATLGYLNRHTLLKKLVKFDRKG